MNTRITQKGGASPPGAGQPATHEPGLATRPGPAGECQAHGLLAKVIAYYEGRKPYDFHRLSDMERSNQAFDAWQELAGEIRAYLKGKSA